MTRTLSLENGRSVALDPWCLMGILNATPDSFSDGALNLDPERAIESGLNMVADGATILDVGGESTRPGAARIPAREQLRRVIPVIEGLRRRSDIPISIDTTIAEVARAALDAGADIVNDVSAGTEDDTMFDLVAKRGCLVVLMHRLHAPEEDSYSDRYQEPPRYDDVVDTVKVFLQERVAAAEARGIAPGRIVLDPGLGFGKTVEQNLELIAQIGTIVAMGHPVLVGASRKSFLGAITGIQEPAARGMASVVMAITAWGGGASILRVHEPGPHREGLEAALAVRCHQGERPATIPFP